jgi:hypothetical protein
MDPQHPVIYINMSDICFAAKYFADNFYLNIILFLALLFCAFGFVFNIILIKIQGTTLAVHKNALILLNNHHISVLLQSSLGIRHAYDLITYRTATNPCELVDSYFTCVLFLFIPTIAQYATFLSLTMMAVERFYASYKYRTYENSGISLGIFLALTQVNFQCARAKSIAVSKFLA